MSTTSTTSTKLVLTPLYDRVVVRPTPRADVTRSGIILPDTAREKPQRGAVLAVGKGRLTDTGDRIDMDVTVGDQILFATYGGTEFTLVDEDLLILSEKDVLAVLTEA